MRYVTRWFIETENTFVEVIEMRMTKEQYETKMKSLMLERQATISDLVNVAVEFTKEHKLHEQAIGCYSRGAKK